MTIKENAQTILNLDRYQTPTEPDYVGIIKLKSPKERQYILRMLIKTAHSGWQIPKPFQWCHDAIRTATEYQQKYIKIRHSFCYLTIRHGKDYQIYLD